MVFITNENYSESQGWAFKLSLLLKQDKLSVVVFHAYSQTLPVPVVVKKLGPSHNIVLGDQYQPGGVT